MRTTAIIQARMGSTRLPGKVMKDLCGAPMLERVVNRTRRATSLSDVVVATTTAPADQAVVDECERLGIPCFRGNETDVLDRYFQAAKELKADAIVRITSDCPLIDPLIVDKTVSEFLSQGHDYASNTLHRTYPRGLDTEVFTFAGLERCWREATDQYQRIHVTPYFYQNPKQFHLHSVIGEHNFSMHRWTVDTPEDLQFIREIYKRLGPGDGFSWQDVLVVLQQQPELSAINQSILQKELHEG